MSLYDLDIGPPTPPMADPLALVVGIAPDQLEQLSLRRRASEQLAHLSFSMLESALDDGLPVACVVTPLVGDRFDALDVVATLVRAGFGGVLQVVVPPLPRPEIIRRELQQVGAGLTVELIRKAPH